VAVAALSLTGSAFAAASTRNELRADMGGTARLAKGGLVDLVVQRVKKQFRVTIKYRVTVRSKTVLQFAAYPCRSSACGKRSNKTKIELGPGNRRVKYTGYIPVVEGSDGFACVFAQLRDRGPRGRAAGKVVRPKDAVLQLCQKGPPAAVSR
jgi:hypothetical protein